MYEDAGGLTCATRLVQYDLCDTTCATRSVRRDSELRAVGLLNLLLTLVLMTRFGPKTVSVTWDDHVACY